MHTAHSIRQLPLHLFILFEALYQAARRYSSYAFFHICLTFENCFGEQMPLFEQDASSHSTEIFVSIHELA